MIVQTKKLVILALFLALAIILNVTENVVFAFFVVPGVKLGLANIATIFILAYYGYREMFLVNVLRVFLASLIMGTLFSIPFIISIISSIGSMLLLYPFYRQQKLSIFGISMIQALFFNIFQIITVSLLYSSDVFFYYLPYLLLSGIITGYLVALSCSYIIKLLTKVL